MPWELQVCRFCDKKYGNKTGLRNHLSQFVGEWRVPADGIHDVLEIKKILNPDPDLDDDNPEPKYRCPARFCGKIIATREKFTEHVISELHWGVFPEGPLKGPLDSNSWVLPFDEKAVKVFQRKGVFPFLRLPAELRLMIYKFVLKFRDIFICTGLTVPGSTRYNKAFYQRNPSNNPLSLLITCRTIYYEARKIFYSQNSFMFSTVEYLPIFLIGIGQENAMLLRSVQWPLQGKLKNRLSSIRSHIWGVDSTDPTETGKLNIWSDHPTYLDFLSKISASHHLTQFPESSRFLRWNPGESTRAKRVRYVLHCHFIDDMRSPFRITTDGGVTYELVWRPKDRGRQTVSM